MIDALEEKVTPVWVQKLECELSSVRDKLINFWKDLDTQRFTFERHLEAETSLLYSRIDSLEKQNVDEYNSGLSFFYDCIKFVLKKDYLELDMNKFEAGVNAYMNDQNWESGEEGNLLRPHRMQLPLEMGSLREQMWILLQRLLKALSRLYF